MRFEFPIVRNCLGLALMVSLAWPGPPRLHAEEPRQDWSRVQALPADQKIVVKAFKGMGPKVKGAYVSSDADRLIVRRPDGQTVTIPKDRIRLVLGKVRHRHTVWIGAAAGFTIIYLLGVAAARDPAPEGIVAFGGIGAGIGALLGLAAKAAGKKYIVYQAENTDRSASTTP